VKLTLEDIRRHFGQLSDDALLATNREDLVDPAKQCLDDEIARRGLVSANAPNPHELRDGEKMVPIAKFHFRSEFEAARALLRSAMIPSKQGNRIGRRAELELPLMVPAAFAEQALELLKSRVSDDELAALAEAAIAETDSTEKEPPPQKDAAPEDPEA
jgi:hypothetical protein